MARLHLFAEGTTELVFAREVLGTYEQLKATVGPQMAGLIGLQKIRAACPHFDAWVRRLEQLENG